MTTEERAEYYNLFNDCWKLLDKYKNPSEIETYWELLVDEAEQLIKKHNSSLIACEMVSVVMNEIERLYSNEQIKKNGCVFNSRAK